jgi:hypothetical protein
LAASNYSSHRAALPNAHEINQIETQSSQPFPFLDWNIGDSDPAARFAAKVYNPRQRVNLIKLRMKSERLRLVAKKLGRKRG